MRRAGCALAALAISFSAAAQTDPRWYLQVDNDVVFATDRWYTSGVRIARVARHGDYELEWAIQQDVFTPEAKEFVLGRIDRAPAARLFAAVARHDRAEMSFTTLQLAAGVAGPSALGEQSTDAIHRVIAAPDVAWERELPDRVDLHGTYSRSDRFGRVRLHHGVVLGNLVSFAHAGAEWRFGDTVADLASPMLRFAPTPPWSGSGAAGWNAFAGASLRYVARNRLLERPYDPAGERLEREKSIVRVAAGVSWQAGWGSATFAVAQDSREFEGQREPQRFGSLTVHVPF